MTDAERLARAEAYRVAMSDRRSCRAFLTDPVDRQVIETAIGAAASAPSGANKQPWTFVAVGDPEVKRRLRERAENEERRFYSGLGSREWIGDLEPLGTTWRKPFLEDAPWLIVVFAHAYAIGPDGQRLRRYYVRESVGIAVGFLISALHHAGLGTLTYTPAKMGFLTEVLDRPPNERPFMVVAAGLRDPAVAPPAIERKPLDEVMRIV
jgi:nitroreductase